MIKLILQSFNLINIELGKSIMIPDFLVSSFVYVFLPFWLFLPHHFQFQVYHQRILGKGTASSVPFLGFYHQPVCINSKVNQNVREKLRFQFNLLIIFFNDLYDFKITRHLFLPFLSLYFRVRYLNESGPQLGLHSDQSENSVSAQLSSVTPIPASSSKK